MSKKIASKAFGLVSVLAALVVILAACGESTGGSGGGESSSSRGGANIMSSAYVNDSLMEANGYGITAKLDGQADDVLEIRSFVNANRQNEIVFDYVDVKIDDKKINPANAGGGFDSYTFNKDCDFVTDDCNLNKDYCDNVLHEVCIYAYVTVKNKKEEAAKACDYFKREDSKCRPPSSDSSPSSSSAAPKNFVLVNSEGFTLNSQNGNRGIILGSGTLTTNIQEADIYYEASGVNKGNIKTEKNAVDIITEFKQGNSYGEISSGDQNDPPYIIKTPQSTTDFVFNGLVSGEKSAQPNTKQYYLVRVSSASGYSANEWGPGSYLVLVTGGGDSPGAGDNKFIEIQVWKVN